MLGNCSGSAPLIHAEQLCYECSVEVEVSSSGSLKLVSIDFPVKAVWYRSDKNLRFTVH